MKYLLTFFVTIFFFALTYESAPTEFSPVDLVFIGFLILVVIAVECLIARLFAPYRLLQNLVLAGFATVNILYLNLVLNEGFIALPRYGQALALLVAVFIIVTLLNMLDDSRRVAKILPALFGLATVGVVVVVAVTAEPPVPTFTTEPGKTSAENVRPVDFARKPNLYFVGFDSLIPQVLLKNHLGLETTAYHEVLDANFRRFRNFFADRIATLQSLNSLLALDIRHYDNSVKDGTEDYFFTGLRPSPLLKIFKHNGYETTTFFRSRYFGEVKGQFVDNYHIANSDDFMSSEVCEFTDIWGFRVVTFFGYCYLTNMDEYENLLSYIVGFQPIDQMDALISHMRDGLKKNTPQIFVAYIYSPGHTRKSYEHNNKQDAYYYRVFYKDGSEITATYLKKLVTFIRDEDPTGIVYVFGDHGPFLHERIDVNKDRTFFVHRKFGAYGGIFPKDRCENTFSQLHNTAFMTIAEGAHLVIRCLSDGKDAFLTQQHYRLPDDIGPGVSNRYEDYLYE